MGVSANAQEIIWGRVSDEDQLTLALPGMLLQDAPEWIGRNPDRLGLSGAYTALVDDSKPVVLPPHMIDSQAMSKYRYLRAKGMAAGDIRYSRFSSVNEIIKENLLQAGHFKITRHGGLIMPDSNFLETMLRTWTDHTTRALLQVAPGEVMDANTPRMQGLRAAYDQIKQRRDSEIKHWKDEQAGLDAAAQAQKQRNAMSLANKRARASASARSSEDELRELGELAFADQRRMEVQAAWGRMA